MFNDPIDQKREKLQNQAALNQMKIEDQTDKHDLTDVSIPKGIYENNPTYETNEEYEDTQEEEDIKEKIKEINEDSVSVGSNEN